MEQCVTDEQLPAHTQNNDLSVPFQALLMVLADYNPFEALHKTMRESMEQTALIPYISDESVYQVIKNCDFNHLVLYTK